MADIDMSAHCLFFGPIKVRDNGLDTGPLDQSHHKARGKNLRHDQELACLRIESRNRL